MSRSVRFYLTAAPFLFCIVLLLFCTARSARTYADARVDVSPFTVTAWSRALHAHRPLLVEVFAAHSQRAALMKPVVDGLAARWYARMHFLVADADSAEGRWFEREYRVGRGLHFVLVNSEGRIARRFQGRVTAIALEDGLEAVAPPTTPPAACRRARLN